MSNEKMISIEVNLDQIAEAILRDTDLRKRVKDKTSFVLVQELAKIFDEYEKSLEYSVNLPKDYEDVKFGFLLEYRVMKPVLESIYLQLQSLALLIEEDTFFVEENICDF